MSLEGQQIDRYRIVRLLGSGGMGDVYLAEDARIEQQVAIKVIRAEASPYPDDQASQDAARLFQREARAIARLDHPHILPLYDYGEERLGNMTVIYLVMPYRKEGSLTDWLRQRGQAGRLAPQEVVHIVRQAVSALQHAHTRQIIHQDVKPSNFLIHSTEEDPNRPDLLLADFGVAKLASATSSMSHTIRGTPTYMAPEQWSGEPVPATDQYALAIMAYELLAGRPPFQGPPMRLMHLHATTPPPAPSTFNPRLPTEVDNVLLHALAKKPEERFASITAFATAFQQAVQAPAAEAATTPTYISATPPPTPAPASSSDLRAVLAISTTEAQKGTTRTLTLPGGRQVTVNVPAGAHDGQVVRLEGQGETSPTGGPSGALILSILVKTMEEPSPLAPASAEVAEETVLTANPTTPASAPTVSNAGQQPPVSSAARPEMIVPASPSTQPTQATPPASPATSLPTEPGPIATEPGFPAKPSVGLPIETTPPTQLGQQARVVPVVQSSQPPTTATAQLQRGISRRTVVVGLTGLAVVGVAGGGLLWLTRFQQPTAQVSPGLTPKTVPSPTPPPSPTPSPSPTPLTVGSTLYIYRGHHGDVFALEWSPDGRRIASGSWDGTVQVWDAADGGNVFIYRGHGGAYVYTVAWSPDGRRIASGGEDHTVQVWDTADGGNVFIYRGHNERVEDVTWSPDSKRIASGSLDNTVQVWDAADGRNVFIYRGHASYVGPVAWSPDGKRIASGSLDNTVQVWDAADGGNVFIYRGHSKDVISVVWSPDGKRIASGSLDNTVQVWDAADGGNVYIHHGVPAAVAWSPDGKRIASVGLYPDNKTLQVWDAADGGHVFTYRGLANSAFAEGEAWSPDSKRIASGGSDFRVYVWLAG